MTWLLRRIVMGTYTGMIYFIFMDLTYLNVFQRIFNLIYQISYYILMYPFHFSYILGPGTQAQAQECKKNEKDTSKYVKLIF